MTTQKKLEIKEKLPDYQRHFNTLLLSVCTFFLISMYNKMERYYDRTDELRRDVAVNTDKIKTNSLRIINLESLVYLGKPGRVQIPNPDTQ